MESRDTELHDQRSQMSPSDPEKRDCGFTEGAVVFSKSLQSEDLVKMIDTRVGIWADCHECTPRFHQITGVE